MVYIPNYNEKKKDKKIYQTKTIRCVEQDCQELFEWTPEEQEWFDEHDLKYPPVRCLDCRRKRRLARQ